MKINLKRIGSFVLALVIALSALPGFVLTAKAAGTTLQTIDGLVATYTTPSKGKAEWSADGTTIVGKATGYNFWKISKSAETTLTFTNNSGSKATLKFHYELKNGGSLIGAISGISGDSDDYYNAELGAGKSISITLISPAGESNTNKLTISGLSLIRDDAGNVTTTFKPAENGSFKVAAGSGSAQEVTEEISKTAAAGSEYTVTATANDGHIFFGWYNVEKNTVLSTDATYTFSASANMTISPKFVANTTAIFGVGASKFIDLNEACAYAHAGTQKTVILLNSGPISGNYIIPDDVTLLIPFDEVGTLYTTTPIATRSTMKVAKPFRTLTMRADSSLTVRGAISVGGQYYASSGSEQGKMVGPYGFIKMESGSTITVENGANLYAWGFISGSGAVTVESGGSVYEWYQVLDFRGGSAILQMDNNNKVFPFNQYAVQNVEVPLKLYAGASETVYTAVYGGFVLKEIHTTSIPFIVDKDANTGMFRLVSGSLTKAYDGSTDRIIYTIDGEAQVNSLNLELAGMTVSSSDFVLPLTNNMTINLTPGSELTVNQTAALLPGVQASIAKDAELVVSTGKSIYIYDVDEWGSYCSGGGNEHFVPVAYAPGRTGKRAPLADAKVDVNGTLTAKGGVYTTASGADICSSEGTGQYVQMRAPDTNTTPTYQYTQSGSDVTAHEIPITPARLHNADGTYTETANASAGDTINYVSGVWGGTPCAHENTELRNAKDETCTEPGYTGDTYCKDCGEKIGTGTAIPAKGHTEVIDPAVEPTCTEPGLTEGKHCSACGAVIVAQTEIPAKGHTEVIDAAKAPTCTEPGLTEGKHCSVCNEVIVKQEVIPCPTGWLESEQGRQYYKDGELQKTGWTVIDGNTYYLDTETGYAATGIAALIPQGGSEKSRCVFDAEGVFQSDVNGVYSVGNDTYWLNSGIIEEEAGLKCVVKENGEVNYYYFVTSADAEANKGKDFDFTLSKAVKGNNEVDFWITKTNGLRLPEWGYFFDENGVILHDEDTGKNGILNENDGKYYYVDGIKAPAGMIKDGNDYYYVRSNGQLVVNRSYYCSNNHGLMADGTYTFDEEGRLKIEIPKNGIVGENDSLYYYKDGKLNYAGLIEIDGSYYYVRTSGEVVHGRKYWITKTNGLMPMGSYEFDDEGKMINPPKPTDPSEKKNGIVSENGSLYYYKDGQLNYAGLIEIEGLYYYVRTNGEVVHGRKYWITKTNGLMPEGSYEFDADGKMILG